MRKIDRIIIHCSATKPSMDIGVDEIRRWHKAKGWRDVGYHFVIKRDGTLESGRPVHQIGAHAKGYNSNSIGICYVGGVDENKKSEDNRTVAQIATMNGLILNIKNQYEIISIIGHTDLKGVAKDCPCFDVATYVKDYNL